MLSVHDNRDDGSLMGKNHRPHMNKGPQITPRLERLLHIIGQQGALRFDQVQQWLARLSPEPYRMKEPDLLSTERSRKFLRPWLDQQLLMYKVFYARQRGWLWLTPKGYKAIGLDLRYYEPAPASLPHLYAVNEIRFLIDARRPADTWRSERELRAEQNARSKGSIAPHLPDAELISANGSSVVAIECELTVKSEKRLEEIVFDLAAQKRYTTIWYFLPEEVYRVVKKAVDKLPREHQKRFIFYTLKGELYTS